MLNTVSKAGKILNLFSFKQPEWGVSEIARLLDISKSTASEIMTTLAEAGLLTRTSSGRYRLGWRLFELSQVLLDNTEFCTVARLAMQELVERWGETTHLAVLEGAQVVYVEKLQATPAAQILLSRVGARLPAHCSGVGKVLLAYQEWQKVAELMEEQEMRAFTPNTITCLDALAAELALVRAQGFAFDHEEVALGLCCVAAPIYDVEERTIAAISMSIPAYRFYPQQDNYTSIILKTANHISENLGYRKKKPIHTGKILNRVTNNKANAERAAPHSQAGGNAAPAALHLVTEAH
jgi:DNA-binding IclR family transcriptional regulator